MKQTLSMAGIGLLGGLAIAAWMPSTSVTPVEAAPAAPVALANGFQALPAVAQIDGAAPVFQTVANRRSYYRDDRAQRAPARTYNSRDRRYSNDNYRYNERGVRDERSTGKSVAIVGGSAAAGAAIGGIAGGGKGAALGAITGGTAGFIYDRLTKDRK